MKDLNNERGKLITLLMTKYKKVNVNSILANDHGCDGIKDIKQFEVL